jgi:DNA-binding CsgD family transcriptional regulator
LHYGPTYVIAIIAVGKGTGPKKSAGKTSVKRPANEAVLCDISYRAIAPRDLQSFLDESLEILGKRLNVGGAFICERKHPSDQPQVLAEWTDESANPLGEKLEALSSSVISWMTDRFVQKQIVNVSQILQKSKKREQQFLRELEAGSVLIVPILVNDEYQGLLGVHENKSPQAWSDKDVALLEEVARIFPQVIERSGLLTDLQEARQRLEDERERQTAELQEATAKLRARQEELLAQKSELEILNKELVETNKAVTVLARNLEQNRQEVERNVALTISSKIVPLVERFIQDDAFAALRPDLEVLNAYVHELTAGLSSDAMLVTSLSPTEMRVASLIKEGLPTSEIAEEMQLSEGTIKTHRRSIRHKLNIQHTRKNLANYLKTRWR